MPTIAALYGMEMSSMMFVASKSLVDACATPEQSAADSSATSTCLVDFMISCAFFAAVTPCLHQRKLQDAKLDANVLEEQLAANMRQTRSRERSLHAHIQ